MDLSAGLGAVKDLGFAGKSILAVGQERKVSVYDFAAQKVRKEFGLQHGSHRLSCMAANAKVKIIGLGRRLH